MPLNVSAAIVTYKGYEKAKGTVASLLEHTKGVDFTLYVIDNNSGDGTLEKLQADFPQIVGIQKNENKGFGNGHNTILFPPNMLESDYHFVVNPDILIDRDVITELAEYMHNHPDIGLITPQIRNPDGTDQQLGKRDPVVLSLVGRRIFSGALKKQTDHYAMLDQELNDITDIEFATGSFFGIETEIYKQINGFDELFFMYYEDMDITRRARAVKRAVYYPFTYVTHLWERSSAHSLKFFWILIVGMFKYFGKWGWKFRYKI